MKRIMLIAATLTVGLASGAFAGPLLVDLATNANKVATSPFASGGDLILKLGDKEYVHVWPAATPPTRMYVHLVSNLGSTIIVR